MVSPMTYSREHASKAKEWREGRTIIRSIHDDRESEKEREKKKRTWNGEGERKVSLLSVSNVFK